MYDIPQICRLGTRYTTTCEDCKCEGVENIDWKKLSDGIPTVEECFNLADKDDFCGRMIVMDMANDKCFCRGVGKQRTCSKRSKSNWNVYQAKMPG